MSGNDIGTSREGIVWEVWKLHAERFPNREAVVHWVAGEPPFRWRWAELVEAASLLALELRDRGVTRGDVCALIIRHNRYFYPAYMAISALGALPAVLAYPNARLHPEKFRQGLEGMTRSSGLDWVLTERELEAVIHPVLSGRGSTIRGVFFPLEWIGEGRRSVGFPCKPQSFPDDPCLLQHSSGTTGLQKAVVLSNRAILEHVRRYGESICLGTGDRIVSWLPLYHDMGLIAAFYMPLTFGIPVVQIDPFEWVSAPVILLEAISRETGTLVWLPNFAYNMLAERTHDEDLEGIRLDSLRILINCSEPVRAKSHDKFYRRFKRYGLKRETLGACYAMAETTFAVTQTSPGAGAKCLSVKRDDLAAGIVQPLQWEVNTRICVSSGAPISGCSIRIVDDSGEDLPGGRVGELAISSVSLFDGYKNNPGKTAEVMKDGWYFSGDYGFAHDGEYYIIGRKKDIIIVAGKNIYPEDIEDAVGQVNAVLPGRVIAFGIEDDATGTEQICIIAETPCEGDIEQKRLRMAIVEAGMGIDVTISRVYLAKPRWLIKSSSGKPSRNANRERALAELAWK